MAMDPGSRPDTSEHEAQEPLLVFKKSFDFKKFVLENLIPPERNDLAQIVQTSAKLVGQEKDGGMLFTWDTASSSDPEEIVTRVGLYALGSPRYRPLYEHESRMNICAASVNFDRTLLAFTIKSSVGTEELFEPFVAEIQPQGRVFTLNMSGNSYRKAQFLHLDITTPKHRVTRNVVSSRLLLIIPYKFIYAYTFKVQMLREGAVLTQQPDQEHVTGNFSWFQWDPQLQRLYYANFETALNRAEASISGRNSLLFHCIKFNSASHKVLLSVSLPLPYSRHVYCTSATYYHSPFAFSLPIREINLQVLHRRDGLWCVCLQHCTGVATNSDSAGGYEDPDTPQGGKVDYSVFILHNGSVLYGQAILPVPSSEALYIHFMLIGCFLAAYIPGFMLHLLNIGPRTDPCHHLAFGPERAPEFPVRKPDIHIDFIEGAIEGPVLSRAITPFVLADYNAALLECSSEVMYECELNVTSFMSLFKHTTNVELRESLLHLMVLGFRNYGVALSMIEYVCQSPMSLVDHRLFAEFMLSSAYANVFFECKRYVSKQLPLTMSSTYRGKVYKKNDGTKYALLKVVSLPNYVQQLSVQCDQKLQVHSIDDILSGHPPSDHPREMLLYFVLTSEEKIARVDFRSVAAIPLESTSQATSTSRSSSQKEFTTSTRGLRGVLNSFARRTPLSSRRNLTHTKTELLDMLHFLDPTQNECLQMNDEMLTLREKAFNQMSANVNALKSKNVVYSALSMYMSELEKQSCTLLLLIWQSLGFSKDSHPLHQTIHRQATVKEQILFELLEAYRLAHMEVGFPVPAGFHSFFVSLGYVCLDPILFLQYLRNGVFVVTKSFVDQFLSYRESMDEDLMYQIITQMDLPVAEYALREWKNPAVRQLQSIGTKR